MTDIIVDLKAFAAAAAVVTPILNPAIKVPAYQHLRVDLVAGRMTLSASDFEVEARASLDAKGDDISFLLPRPSADFLTARAAIGPAEATLSISEGAHEIAAVHGRARIVQPGLPPEDFVPFKSENATLRFTLPAAELSHLINSVKGILPDEALARAYLGGILLHVHDGDMRAVGSNGNSIHVASVTAPDVDGDWPQGAALSGVIVPKRAVERIAAMIAGLENPVAVSASSGFLSVAIGDVMLFTRLIDSNWPDYNRIIPAKSETSFTVDSAALQRALKALAIVPAVKTKSNTGRTVRLDLKPGGLEMSMRGETGAAEDFIPCDTQPIDDPVFFSNRYLEIALAALAAPRVQLTAGDGKIPTWTIEGEGWTNAAVYLAPRSG